MVFYKKNTLIFTLVILLFCIALIIFYLRDSIHCASEISPVYPRTPTTSFSALFAKLVDVNFYKKERFNDNLNVDLLENVNDIFSKYGEIEKNIYISWKNKDIINSDYSIIKN